MRILSSGFLIEMFDLRGKELNYAKELLLNHNRKSVQNSVRLQDMWVELKLKSQTTYIKMFRSRIQKAVERNTAARIN